VGNKVEFVTFDGEHGYGHKHIHKSPDLVPAIRYFSLLCLFTYNSDTALRYFILLCPFYNADTARALDKVSLNCKVKATFACVHFISSHG